MSLGLALLTSQVYSDSSSSSSSDSCHNDKCCIIYVDQHADHHGDGSSWKHAFKDLQCALETAENNGGPNEIWVAEGTYTPTALNDTPNDPDSPPFSIAGTTPTFTIPNHTFLYGGFKGDECERADRNPCKNITILNGDIDGNDLPISDRHGPAFPLPQNYLNSKLDNARHVITLINVDATIDGFTIRKGFAGDLPNLVTDEDTNFLYRQTMRGGGIWARNGNVVLKNIVFDDCEAYDSFDLNGGVGGALFTIGTHLTLDNVKMFDGYASFFSPAFLIANSDCTASGLDVERNESSGCVASFQDNRFDLTKSVFKNNHATSFCGALQVLPVFFEPVGNSRISCCQFEDNIGGVCASIDLINQSGVPMPQTLVKNNQFLRNSATQLRPDNVSCGAICNYSYNAVIENNLFEGNSGLTCGAICVTQNDPTTPVDTYLTIKDNCFKANSQVGSESLGGGAVHLIGDVTADILTNKFFKNSTDMNGGAVAIENATGTLMCNQFADNQAADLGSAVYASCATVNDILECNSFKKPNHNTVVIQCNQQKNRVKNAVLASASLQNRANVLLNP